MTHRRKPKTHRPRAGRKAEPDAIADRRVIANLFGVYHPERCGRESCALAGLCVGAGAPCFDENRERLRLALLDLANSALFLGPPYENEGG